MRNVLKNNNETAHYWANNIQPSGKAYNLFFEDNIIYSYGYHFPIAKHINENIILFTSKDYSSSTGKHKSHVRNAIPHDKKVFTVPNVNIYNDRSNIGLHTDNIKYYISEIKYNLNKSKSAWKYKTHYLKNVLKIQSELKEYLNLFKVKSKLSYSIKKQLESVLNSDNSEILDIIQAENKKQAEIEKKNELKQAEKLKELLPKWRNNKIYSLPYSKTQYLRLINEIVETSLHVKISIETFKKYYSMIKNNISLIGENIDNFKVINHTDNLLTVGCHKITINEINYIANKLNLQD
tara:strand:- start:969 stop:1850 length:882 start_codon:yes stop_codon:yes gene_type:complete